MKNYELYSTPEMAFAAHVEMCKNTTNRENNKEIDCKKCSKSSGKSPCIMNWLYDDCSFDDWHNYLEKIIKKNRIKNKDKYQTLQEAQYAYFNNVVPNTAISFKDWLEMDCDISENDYSYWHNTIVDD